MRRIVPIKKRQEKKPADPYKALVMETWDRMDRQDKREKLWAKEEVNRKAKGRL